ncbi:MAG: hypothetical protein HKM95_15200 [Inquilinus sp.]|nr:hypothetical protein [Inquilinus sp.]
MKIRIILAAVLLSGAAQADCRWVDRPTADRALSILRDAPSVVLGDRIEPEPVPRIGLVAAPAYTESWSGAPFYGLVAHGGREINVEQIYVQSADGGFVGFSSQVGCDGSSMPERLPDMPPVRRADRSGAPVPAVSVREFVGLVDLHSLYSEPEDTRAAVPPHPVTLYSAPDVSAPVHATIPDWDALPSDEMGYEFPAAVVLERDRGWYRIGIVDGQTPPDRRWALDWYQFTSGASAWIAPEDAGEFRSYEDLVTDNLAYLGDRWDGLLSAEPDPEAGVWSLSPEWRRGFYAPDRIDVAVRETRRVGDRLWVRVMVLWPGECEGGMPLPMAEGWVPAHTGAGAPIVRYFSRGC